MDKEELVQLGEEVAEEVYRMEEVEAVGFYGSISIDCHDEKSDVDLIAYVDEIPDADKRAKALEGITEEFETQIDWLDVFHYNETEIGIAYREISDLENDIEKLEEGQESGFIAMFLQNAKPILGKGIIHDLKERIKKYPEELKDKKKENLKVVTRLFIDSEKLLQRGQNTFICLNSLECLERLVEVVYSVNERYYPEDNLKWIEKELDEMEEIPENFEENVNKFVKLRPIQEFPERLELLKKIMFSILDILEEVDKDRLNIEEEDWYDEVIENCKQKIDEGDYR